MPKPKRKSAKPHLVESRKSRGSPIRSSFPIVAIGASAGGLEAFSNLLRALPAEPGVALVFIPHLDPTHESALVELLSRTTRLPVHRATEGLTVSSNTVYVLPPNSDMTISDGVLHLVRREAARGQHMPIDTFFRSLAEDQTTNARDSLRHSQ
jgi:two-component system, chemotaxis family, CheB/CheR fusion protein